MGNVTMSVPCSTVMRDGLPARNSLLSPLTRVLLMSAWCSSYFNPVSLTPVEISLWENTETMRPERAVADRGDDRSVAVQVAGRATVGQ